MRITRYLVAAVILLTLALLAVVVIPLVTPSWVEVVGSSVLRTNAPTDMIAGVQSTIIFRHRNLIVKDDGTKHDPSSSESVTGWKSGSSPETTTAEVTRGHSQITDKDGHRLHIERITSSGFPTLLFIDFDGPEGPQSITTELLQELEKAGVRVK